MDKVTKLSEVTDNNRFRSTKEALEDSLLCIDDDAGGFAGKKILILALDDTHGDYTVSFQRSNLSDTESIALVRIAESMFLKDMGF